MSGNVNINKEIKEKLLAFVETQIDRSETLLRTRDLVNASGLQNTGKSRTRVRKAMRALAEENNSVHIDVVNRRLQYWYGPEKPQKIDRSHLLAK